MTKKRVSFEFEFEYDTEEYPEKTDNEFEMMAYGTLIENLSDLAAGEVHTVEGNHASD